MKKVFLLISLFAFCQVFSQKKYSFDYTLVYEEHCQTHKDTIPLIYLVNSKMSNYNLLALEDKSKDYCLYFNDQDGVAVRSKVKKEDFYKAETYTNSKKETIRLANFHKKEIKNYEFVAYKDTLLNDTLYFHYVVKCLKSIKYQKRKKIGTPHFIISKSNPDFVPLLFHPMVYEKWKATKGMPNGILKMIYHCDYTGEIVSKMRLVAVLKMDKYLTIPEECDYTIEEIRNKPPFRINGL